MDPIQLTELIKNFGLLGAVVYLWWIGHSAAVKCEKDREKLWKEQRYNQRFIQEQFGISHEELKNKFKCYAKEDEESGGFE